MLMIEEKILKFECVLDRIFYPKYSKKIKSGEFGIFKVNITKLLEFTNYDKPQIKSNMPKCRIWNNI